MIKQQLDIEPNLSDLLRALWRIRAYWIASVLLGAVLSLAFYAFLNSYYESRLVVGLSDGRYMQTSLEYRFGGSVLRGQKGADRGLDFVRYQQMFRSAEVIGRILEDNDARKKIVSFVSRDCVIQGCHRDGVGQWDMFQFSRYLHDHVRVYPIGDVGGISVRYRHPNVEFSQYLLSQMHIVTNDMIRMAVVEMSNKRVGYLKSAMVENVNPDQRRVFAQLLLQEERHLMTAQMNEEFAAQKLRDVFHMGSIVWPRMSLMLSLFMVGFFVIGVVVGGICRRK